jgi:hypothetical protein
LGHFLPRIGNDCGIKFDGARITWVAAIVGYLISWVSIIRPSIVVYFHEATARNGGEEAVADDVSPQLLSVAGRLIIVPEEKSKDRQIIETRTVCRCTTTHPGAAPFPRRPV